MSRVTARRALRSLALSLAIVSGCGRVALDDERPDAGPVPSDAGVSEHVDSPRRDGGLVDVSDADTRRDADDASDTSDVSDVSDASDASHVGDASHDAAPSITLTVSVAGGGLVDVTAGGVHTVISSTTTFQTSPGPVRVRAIDAPGAYFASWDVPSCTSADCSFTLDAPRSVTATFVDAGVYVSKQDRGGYATTGGRLFTVDGTLECGAACSRGIVAGTAVTVYATPANGFAFAEWTSGPCAGSTAPECSLVVANGALTLLVAEFQEANLMFVTSPGMTTTALVSKGAPYVDATGTDAERMIAGADAYCTELGTATSRPGTHWRSWLSRIGADAVDRFPGARGWLRTDGAPVLDTLDPTGFRVMYPPWSSQSGKRLDIDVLTGTDLHGHFLPTGGNCLERDALPYPYQQVYGRTVGGSTSWTFTGWMDSCSNPQSFYCMGTDFAAPIRLPHIPGRHLFVSRAVTPVSGIAGLDAACERDAADQGLPGHYRALVADATHSAASRFTLRHERVLRTDSVIVAESDDELIAGHLLAAPERAANALPVDYGVWTGAPALTSVGTSTCNEWTSVNAMGRSGDVRNADPNAFSWWQDVSCLSQFGVYCLEE